jgi:hypothetical protein
MFSGINSVCGKYCCIYCRSHKNSYSEVESFFLENKARSHLEGGLGRDSTDWCDIKRGLYGIKNDMLITIRPDSFIIDTLHLRIRICEKFFSSVISSLISFKKDEKNSIIQEINSQLKANNLKATIHCEVKNENFVKYKIQSLNLNTKIKTIDFIMNLINN